MWLIVIIASLACLALKLAGYLVPETFLERPAPSRIAGLLTVALLSALIGVQTFATGSHISVDARLPALVVAAILFAFKVPFVLVVIAAAATAALIRLAWGG
ncbi:MAG: branched-chain amino acid transporter AzlD [Microbacteriaceae bacterium]|nr:branched-chain amino acid transporter AzlD [Microbacteriaceae bacterium]